MKAPMITYRGAARARKFTTDCHGTVAAEKVALRRIARHRDKNALRIGIFDAAPSRGQTERDVN
jgi:hypothetical protein